MILCVFLKYKSLSTVKNIQCWTKTFLWLIYVDGKRQYLCRSLCEIFDAALKETKFPSIEALFKFKIWLKVLWWQRSRYFFHFLRELAKWWKAIMGYVMSVSHSVRINKGRQNPKFHEIYYFIFFSRLWRKWEISLKYENSAL